MTNEEAKEKIFYQWQDFLEHNIDYAGISEAYKIAIKALEQEPKWIPVSEKLPEAGEYIGNIAKYYLVQNEYGDMLVAKYTHGEYWEQIYQLKPIGDEIVAWMPLPKPYKPQESDDKCKNCKYYLNPDYTRCHECKAESEELSCCTKK